MEITRGIVEHFRIESVNVEVPEPYQMYPRIYVNMIMGVKGWLTKIKLECIYRTWNRDVDVWISGFKELHGERGSYSLSIETINHLTSEAKRVVRQAIFFMGLDGMRG